MCLLEQLERYEPYNEQEARDRALLLRALREEGDVFTRENDRMHMTASAWVVNPARDKVLMVYHKIYDSWSWTGGHADGETDLLAVALREVQEETGVDQLELRDPICVTDHCYLRGGIWHLKHTWWYNMLYTDPVDLTPQREEDITKAAWVARSSLPSFLKNTYPSIVEVFREAK